VSKPHRSAYLNGQLVTDMDLGETFPYRHDRDRERIHHLRPATADERRRYTRKARRS